jgi:hypothetical protein
LLLSRVGSRALFVCEQQGQGIMQLKIQSWLPAALVDGTIVPSAKPGASWREQIVPIAATVLGVLVVATIAVLMGLIT